MTDQTKKQLEPWQIEDAKRLRRLWTEGHPGSQESFGAEYGIGSQGMVWQYLNARRPLNVHAVVRFAQGLGCSVEDISPTLAQQIDEFQRLRRSDISIAGRNGVESLVELKHSGAETATTAYGDLWPGAVAVPHFDVAASMGLGKPQPEQETVIGQLQLSEQWVRRHLNISSPKNLATLTAYGDSMEPTFTDGDILLIDRGVTDIRIDAVYVIALNQELFIKRVQRRMDGSVVIKSDNPLYDPHTVTNEDRDDLRILGRVVWAWNGRKL